MLALVLLGALAGMSAASEPPAWTCGVETNALASRALASSVVAAPAPALAAGPTALRTLVLLMNFQDAPLEPFTVDEVRSRLFLGPASVDAWYREMSDDALSLTGKVRADGDVLGWFTVPYDGAGACNYAVWSDAARVAAEAGGADLAGYDREVYIFPGVTACGFIGAATVSPPAKVWMNGDIEQAFLAHELSHNLGLLHANGLRCVDFTGGAVALSAQCEPVEYGDPFDPMGNIQRSLPRHLGNFHKEKVGFLPADEAPEGTMLTVTTDGVYVLAPSEQPLPGAVQTLRIPRPYPPAGPVPFYLYLDFRQPYGTFFDDFAADDPAVTGVAVRLGPDLAAFGSVYLLDMTPESYQFQDATLTAGRSFFDGPSGITVTVLDVSPMGATVAIAIAPDTVPPAPPTALTAVVAYDASSVMLSWQPVTGDPSVVGYRVFRDGLQIGVTAESSFVDANPVPGRYREYQVVTEDAAGNQSDASAHVTVPVPWIEVFVEMIRPSPGALVPRRTVRVRGRASSDVGIVSIELVLDGVPVWSNTFRRAMTSRVFSRNVRVPALASGAHTIVVFATDTLGRLGVGTRDVIRP